MKFTLLRKLHMLNTHTAEAFFLYLKYIGQRYYTIRSNGHHEQNASRMRVKIILIANVDNGTMQHGGPYHGGLLRYYCIIWPPVSHSPTKYDNKILVILS